MEINFEDYLSEQERKDIVANVFMAKCQARFEQDAERIFSNAAHESVFRILNEHFDGEMASLIAEKAKKVIGELSGFTVFRRKDHWEKEESEGYKALQTAVAESKQLLRDKIASIIEAMDKAELRETVIDQARELLDEKLFGWAA